MADHWPGVMRARRLSVAPNGGCGVRSCIGSPHAGPTHGGAPSRTTPIAQANNAYAAPRVDGPARHALPPRSRPVRPANRTRSPRHEPMLDRSRIRSRAGAHRRRLVGACLVTSGTVGMSARRSARVGPGAPLDRLGRGRSGGRASGSRAGFRRRGRGRLGRPPGRRGAASALRPRPTLGRPTELVQLVLGPARPRLSRAECGRTPCWQSVMCRSAAARAWTAASTARAASARSSIRSTFGCRNSREAADAARVFGAMPLHTLRTSPAAQVRLPRVRSVAATSVTRPAGAWAADRGR